MLERLVCRNFRNLEALDWRVDPGAQLLIGANGAGKTSLLEAVYLLTTTRSFRASRLDDCVSHGETSFALRGSVGGERRVDLAVLWEARQGLDRRANDRRSELAEHLGLLPVVSWSQADAAVLAGAPEARRRFLDQGIVGVQPAAVGDLSRYRQALRQKRELLIRGGRGLASWNTVLAQAAARLVERRAEYCRRIGTAFADELRKTGMEIAEVELQYRPSPKEALEGESAILSRFEAAATNERERGGVLLGPHRDELEITLGGHPLRRTASSGERKVLGLVLLAARARVLEEIGRSPVVLVDDADAELDRGRLQAVWKVLSPGRQVLATSSRPEAWEGWPELCRWRVEGGRIRSAEGASHDP